MSDIIYFRRQNEMVCIDVKYGYLMVEKIPLLLGHNYKPIIWNCLPLDNGLSSSDLYYGTAPKIKNRHGSPTDLTVCAYVRVCISIMFASLVYMCITDMTNERKLYKENAGLRAEKCCLEREICYLRRVRRKDIEALKDVREAAKTAIGELVALHAKLESLQDDVLYHLERVDRPPNYREDVFVLVTPTGKHFHHLECPNASVQKGGKKDKLTDLSQDLQMKGYGKCCRDIGLDYELE